MYAAGGYDVVAVDQTMPVYDGLEVIRILASQGYLPPTIMITGTGNEKIAVEAIKLGAGDYIVKDVDSGYLDLLPAVIERALQQQRLAEEKQRAEETLRQRNRELALLNRANQALTSTLNLEQVLDIVLEEVRRLLEAVACSVWLTDPATGELVCEHFARFHGLESKVARRRIGELLEIVGIADRRRTKVSDLSTGLRQKMNFVRGFVCDPAIVFLDEPTLGLSPKLRIELQHVIGRIRETGVPLIIVDQNVEFLTALVDRLFLFDHGSITREIDAASMPSHDEIMEMMFGAVH